MTVLLFGSGALVIAVAGARLAAIADRLSDLTGLGEAVFGAVLLGATTSLPETVVSITTALAGRADLAVGNAVGGLRPKPRSSSLPTWSTVTRISSTQRPRSPT